MHTIATGLLADDHWHGGPWFLIFPLLWLAFLALVFVTLRRTVWRRGCHGGPVGPFGAVGRFGPRATRSRRWPCSVSATRAVRSTGTSTVPGAPCWSSTGRAAPDPTAPDPAPDLVPDLVPGLAPGRP